MEIEEGFERVARTSLAEQVAGEIQKTVLGKGLKPGSRIPSERRLAELMGVSRIVVREALKMLGERGLVEVQTGKGTFVSEMKPSSIAGALEIYLQQQEVGVRQLQEVRRVLETAIVIRAAERATPADLKLMQEALDGHRKAIERMEVRGLDDEAFEAFVYADLGFHYAIALASQNPLFVLLVSSLSDLMVEIRRAASPHLRAIKTALEVHQEIYAAIEAKDPNAARGYMVQHLDQIEELLRARDQGGQTAGV